MTLAVFGAGVGQLATGIGVDGANGVLFIGSKENPGGVGHLATTGLSGGVPTVIYNSVSFPGDVPNAIAAESALQKVWFNIGGVASNCNYDGSALTAPSGADTIAVSGQRSYIALDIPNGNLYFGDSAVNVTPYDGSAQTGSGADCTWGLAIGAGT